MTSPRDEVATSSAASGAVEDPGLLGAANHDPRHWATPEHPDPHPFGLARDHPDTSASAWASISASVNTSPASKPKPPSPLSIAASPASNSPDRPAPPQQQPARLGSHSGARAPCLTQTAKANDR
jgi:hypothetical protein